MSWTDERVEMLKKLWGEGLSASQIAGRLGGVSRNAVIGKVHRLGLSGRTITSRNKPARTRPRIGTIKRPSKPRIAANGNPAFRALYNEGDGYTPIEEDTDIAVEDRVKLVDLTEDSCRYPIGDPQTPEFGFCNRSRVPGLRYCKEHAQRAYQPPQARRSGGSRQEQPVTIALPKTAKKTTV